MLGIPNEPGGMPLHIILLLRLFRMWHVVKFLEVSFLLLSRGWDLHQVNYTLQPSAFLSISPGAGSDDEVTNQ